MLAALLMALGLTAAPSARAVLLTAEECRAALLADLKTFGIEESQTESIALLPRLRSLGRDGELLYGANAWIRFPQRRGYLVVIMDRFCRVTRRYSSGEVKVSGIPHY